jgi:hypothetical protein
VCGVCQLKDKLDVLSLLECMGENYVLIKMDPSFPAYVPGSDLDVIVFDRLETLKRIVNYYDSNLADNCELKVKDENDHCYIDFICEEGQLDLRIDLIDNFEFLTKISVKLSFLTHLFVNRNIKDYGDFKVYVPCLEDELTLRYFEYLEWFERRPDKIKHLDYICNVEDDSVRQRFIENTHRFIQFKRKVWHGKVPPEKKPSSDMYQPKSRREALKMMSRSVKYLTRETLRRWVRKII